jgi:hypothetical protein
LAKIPENLHTPINTAYPDYTLLVGSVLSDGRAQISPRGSLYVYDSEHFAMWERGRGTTNENLVDGSKLTILYRNMSLQVDGPLPRGGIARFFGTARLIKEGPLRDEIYNGIIKHEQGRDPEKKGFAVLIKVDIAEHITGDPLSEANPVKP